MERYEYSEEQRLLLEHLPVPFAVYQLIDKKVAALILSDGFCDLAGYRDRKQAYYEMDHNMFGFTHPEDKARIGEDTLHFVMGDGRYDVVYRMKTAESADYHIVHAVGKHMNMPSGVRLAYVWYTDEGIYEPQEETGVVHSFACSINHELHEQGLAKAGYYDHLTGLPSMTYFFELSDVVTAVIRREGDVPVLLFLDLCGMKYYNTKFGFAEGDKLLREFAILLIRLFSNENCCHVGADHFAVYTGKEGLEDKLQRLFAESRKLNDRNSIPVHVGIYVEQAEAVSVSEAFDRAKIACDVLRNHYGSDFNYYQPRLRDDTEQRQYILSHLDQALEEKWIKIYNQPIVRAVTGRVSDEEALARWVDPVKGVLAPFDFIPYLEEAGLIYKLDLYVLEQVIEKIRVLEAAGLYIVPQSINLSRSDFDACDMVEEIRTRVDDAGIGHDKITIEITESVIGKDMEFMKEQVRRFRALGFCVWMDDFGSGYSSLDVLQSIRFDLIKFDMSFMKKLDEGENGKIVLTEMVKLATALGLDTVCEGVETEQQVRFLQEIGCSKLQGYYYTKPIPLEALLERYEKGIQIGFENPEESGYYEALGRINLYDLTVVASEDEMAFQNIFSTIPMGIAEVKEGLVKFVRTNQSYRTFVKRFFGGDLSEHSTVALNDSTGFGTAFLNAVKQCRDNGNRIFFEERASDGSIIHSFARRISVNPVAGKFAVAIAVLSVSEAERGTNYSSIARALASDYYRIYFVNTDTDHFIEYSSPIGEEEIAVERHGDDFFASARHDAMLRVHEDERDQFIRIFTKEELLRELDANGFLAATYREIGEKEPVSVNMKITRIHGDEKHIIIGVSIAEEPSALSDSDSDSV